MAKGGFRGGYPGGGNQMNMMRQAKTCTVPIGISTYEKPFSYTFPSSTIPFLKMSCFILSGK